MSRKIAYSGILLAINLILLLLINVIPINTLFLMGLASLPIAIIIMEYGPKSGFVFYIASVILGFIVINSKFQWVLNTFTFGIYGLIKYIFVTLPKRKKVINMKQGVLPVRCQGYHPKPVQPKPAACP